jgi:hypothetical protein
MGNLRHVTLCLAATLVSATALQAQTDRRLQIAFTPKISYFLASNELGSTGVEGSDPIDTEATSKIAFGAAIDFTRAGAFLGLRISGDRVSDVPLERDDLETGGTMNLTMVSASVLVNLWTPPMTGLFHTYLYAGAGLKNYQFEEGSAAVPQLSGSRTTPTAHFGGGTFLRLPPLQIVIEGAVYPSWFNADDPQLTTSGQLQTDFFAHIGLRIPIR